MCPQKIIFQNCNILEVESGDTLRNATIIVEDTNIAKVGKIHTPTETDYEVIDMNGLWAMPGLIDLHAHVCEETNPFIPFDNFETDEPEFFTGARVERNLKETIRQGVTTIRDLGAISARNILARKAVEKKIISGPRIFACGHLITYPAGHLHKCGIQARGTDEVRRAVQRNVDLGANVIKVTNDPQDVEARSQNSGDPTFTHEEFSALVDEAHSHNLKVACHTYPSIQGITNAMNAGVDTLEHAVPLNEYLLERFIREQIIVVPTFVAAYDEYSTEVFAEKIRGDVEHLRKYDTINYPKGSLSHLRPNGIPVSIQEWCEYLVKYLPIAIRNGVCIGIGSDAGCAGTNFRSALREMFLLTQVGATNLQVIQYATLNGAKAVGLDGKLGKISANYLADIIFTPDNPADSLDFLLDIKSVYTNGVFLTN